MYRKNWNILFITTLLLAFTWLGSGVGCGKDEPKPNCVTNLDCTGEQTCVSGFCTAKSNEGGSCSPSGATCLLRNNDGKALVCDRGTCKVRCQTNLDCDNAGESCNIDTGLCGGGQSDAGGEQPIADEGPSQQISEECGPGRSCDKGLDCIKLEASRTNGKCWKGCSKNSDCTAGRICAGSHCIPYAEKCQMAGGKLTQPCWAGLDCVLASPAEGTCYRSCQADTDCSGGRKCALKGQKKYCMQAGDVAGPGQPCGKVSGKTIACTKGYQCIPERPGSSREVCTKECAKDSECQWPRYCQGSICILGNVGTVTIGNKCSTKANATTAEKCDGGLYCLVLSQKSQEGLCYRDCKGKSPACPSGTTCTQAASQSLCLKGCKDDKECTAPTSKCGKLQGMASGACLHPAQ